MFAGKFGLLVPRNRGMQRLSRLSGRIRAHRMKQPKIVLNGAELFWVVRLRCQRPQSVRTSETPL